MVLDPDDQPYISRQELIRNMDLRLVSLGECRLSLLISRRQLSVVGLKNIRFVLSVVRLTLHELSSLRYRVQ